ncbi:MAG: hypothetical protein IT383_18915 [Deltaproteobacteria bacterium]|nr:hypothetical protein [Deltaproteobacteria bacterium]
MGQALMTSSRYLAILTDLDGSVVAVPHDAHRTMPVGELLTRVKKSVVVVDVKSMIDPPGVPQGQSHWSL